MEATEVAIDRGMDKENAVMLFSHKTQRNPISKNHMILMWDIKLKAINEQTRKKNFQKTQTTVCGFQRHDPNAKHVP